MLTLLLLMRADAGASLRTAASGERGAEGQVAAIAALGGSVISQWGLLGRYDLAVIATFPDQDTAASYCLLANSAGFSTEAHLALAPNQLNHAASLIASQRQAAEDALATEAPPPAEDTPAPEPEPDPE